MIRSIDLDFHAPNVIASHVISKGDTHVLVDPGPYSTFPHLATELNRSGLQPSDLAAVLLTHIHFDHAGASWALAQAGVPVYVHPLGYPHMLNPEKLVASATRIYGDRMDELWSVLRPIDARLLHEVADEDELSFGPLRFVAHHTPGHAVHHIAWQLDDALFTGDVAGVKITDGPVQPPCPPPDIHLEDWAASLRRIRHLNPQRLFLAHFGEVTDVFRHLDNLEAELHAWADWVKDRMQQGHTADDMLDILWPFPTAVCAKLAAPTNTSRATRAPTQHL